VIAKRTKHKETTRGQRGRGVLKRGRLTKSVGARPPYNWKGKRNSSWDDRTNWRKGPKATKSQGRGPEKRSKGKKDPGKRGKRAKGPVDQGSGAGTWGQGK